MQKTLTAIAASLLLTACVGPGGNVPATKLAINPQTGEFTYDSPKQFYASNLVVNFRGQESFKADVLRSENSPDVIAAVAAANAQMADKLLQLADKLIQLGEKGGATAVVPQSQFVPLPPRQ